jgi:hypothetical protein
MQAPRLRAFPVGPSGPWPARGAFGALAGMGIVANQAALSTCHVDQGVPYAPWAVLDLPDASSDMGPAPPLTGR